MALLHTTTCSRARGHGSTASAVGRGRRGPSALASPIIQYSYRQQGLGPLLHSSNHVQSRSESRGRPGHLLQDARFIAPYWFVERLQDEVAVDDFVQATTTIPQNIFVDPATFNIVAMVV
ncbi:hypothetical protein MY11210_006723 [Beauveria gryllotalpidicola]